MAITPNERQNKRLEELNGVADYLESQIDRELKNPSYKDYTDTISVYLSDITNFCIDALFDKSTGIMENLKQRYREKGWQNVKFECGSGDEYTGAFIVVEFVSPGVPGAMVEKIVTGFIGIILIPVLFFVLLFYFPFLVLAGILLLFFYFAFFSRS